VEIKSMDINGVNFLILEEGIVLKPYLDSVGVPTIGVGCTYYENGIRVKMSDPPITKLRAIELFRNVLKTYEQAVWSVTRDDINQNQFNALVSICYNIGVAGFKGSTLLKRVNNNPKDSTITEAFKMWRKPAVLLTRRIREAKLYFS
jgi:lysozyme